MRRTGRRSRRVTAALGVVAALAIGAAACGSSAGTGHATASRAAGDVQAVGALPASAADLVRSDLPGYRSGPPDPGIWTPVEAGPAARCLGYGTARPVRQVPSPMFSPASDLVTQQVASDVAVFPSVSQARRVEHALAGSAAAQCIQGALRRALQPEAAAGGLRLEAAVETTSLPMAPAGARDWFAYRLALTAAPSDPREHSFSVYDDLMGFRVKQDLVEMNAYSARQLFPASREKALLDLLYRRALRL